MTLKTLGRFGLITICVAIAAMWVYAFGFASKESANKINDREWAKRADTVCATARQERTSLADLSRVDVNDTAQLAKKATIIDSATDTLERMLTTIESQPPTDAKGLALVPQWIADYRSYIQDRRDYADEFRAGKSGTFAETQREGVPISEIIGQFAQDNLMDNCIPPLDLSA